LNVELAKPDVQVALVYLTALDAQGYSPTVEELEVYARQPHRRGPVLTGGVFGSGLSAIAATVAEAVKGTKTAVPGEAITDYLFRVKWASNEDGRVVITQLGRAVRKAVESQDISDDQVVVLEPGDPVALGRVVEHFARSGNALLVDPYFRLDHLMLVVGRTVLTRVLTSERVDTADLQGLRTGIEQLTLTRPFEVRVAGRELHDRYLIPPTGSVTYLGSSMNGIGHVVTAMARISDGADELRRTYEEIWTEATSLAHAKKSPEGGV
jgi:hypothetical protein